jgi:uncharacterized protein
MEEKTRPEGQKGGTETSVLHSNRIHGSLSLVLILLAAFLFAQTINALKEYRYIGGGIAPTNAITLSGTGEVFVKPDTALFTFGITKDAETAEEAQQAVSTVSATIIDALKGRGVEESNIKTTYYELQPKFEWEPLQCVRIPCDRKQVQKGFTVSQSVEVRVKDLNSAGEMLGLATENGATNVGSLSFILDDEDAKKQEARALAIEDARTKAETLANDLGVVLVRIVGFDESGAQPYLFARSIASYAKDADESTMTTPQVPAGENLITSQVSITYEIR